MQIQQAQKKPPASQHHTRTGEIVLGTLNLMMGLVFLAIASVNTTSLLLMIGISLISGTLLLTALSISLHRLRLASVLQVILALLGFVTVGFLLTLTRGTPPTIILILIGVFVLLSAFFAWSAWLLKRIEE